MIKYDVWENCSVELQSLFFKVLKSLISENKAISYNMLIFEENQVLKNLFYVISKNYFPVELLGSFIELLKAYLIEKKDQSTVNLVTEIIFFSCASHQNENEQLYSKEVDLWYQTYFPFPTTTTLKNTNLTKPSSRNPNLSFTSDDQSPSSSPTNLNNNNSSNNNNSANEILNIKNSMVSISPNIYSTFEKDSTLKNKIKQGASFQFLKNLQGTPKNIIFRNLMLNFIFSFIINEKENEQVCALFYNILTTDFIFHFINQQTHWTSVVITLKIFAILLEKPSFVSKFRSTDGWQHLYSLLPYFHDHREIYYILLSILIGKPRVTQIPHFSLLSPDFSNIYSIFDISVSSFYFFFFFF